MIATVHRYRSSLPGRRVELYAEISEVFLGKRQQARGLVIDLTPIQKQRVLQPLAYYMMCEAKREILLADALSIITEPLRRVSPRSNGKDFLKIIENSSGLLLEREIGIYSFVHKTFQEYMAAVHIQDQKLESELMNHIEDDWWHETIRLYAAQADATSIIEACIANNEPSVLTLNLAIQCSEESREVTPHVRIQLQNFLEASIEDTDPERRKIASVALLVHRLDNMKLIEVEQNETNYMDISRITHSDYQIFLDEQQLGNHYHPDHWLELKFPTGKGKAPIVGVRPSDAIAYCGWLTQRDPDKWYYRLPREDELDIKSIDDRAKSWLKSGRGCWIRSNKGFKFWTLNAKPVIDYPMLKDLLLFDFKGRFNCGLK
jgi:hypothetical protein